MKKTNTLFNRSLYFALIGALVAQPAFSKIRIDNNSRASYANAYNQVNQMANQPQNFVDRSITSQVQNVPTTDDTASTNQETNNNIVKPENECPVIYPEGNFVFADPTLGAGVGAAKTCTAVVELRALKMGDMGEDLVLATGNLALGDNFVCNIYNFPELGYNAANIEKVTVPFDREPTIDDVIKVMNEEQKKYAGYKIAAGTVIGGLFGNLAGKNDVGNDSLLGTDKGKLEGSAIGALSGAAVMAANSYTGKVAGDVILSSAVNAAAGSVVGNIMSSSGSVYRIEKCTLDNKETHCLWGTVEPGTEIGTDENAYFNLTDRSSVMVCDNNNKNCKPERLVGIILEHGNTDIRTIEDPGFWDDINDLYVLEQGNNPEDGKIMTSTTSDRAGFDGNVYAKIENAKRPSKSIPAVIVDVADKSFGFKGNDWEELRKQAGIENRIYTRGLNGNPTGEPLNNKEEDFTIYDFTPLNVYASDGGVIDYGNKARLTDTLVGAGTGGAAGAFVAYQGAQDDIENRWVNAVREYNDSLQKFYCATGRKFLGFYNDTVYVPKEDGTVMNPGN